MRALLLEVAGIAVVALVLVSAALGLLPGASDASWFDQTKDLALHALTFSYGFSTIARKSVIEATAVASLFSLSIITMTAVLLTLIAVPLGVLAARRSQSPRVRLLRRIITSISSLPVLFWGTVVFVLLIRITGVSAQGVENPVGAVLAAVLSLVLGDRLLADIAQRTEISTQEILAEPYMRTVRAGSLGYRRHLLQSLVPPIAETIASRSMFLIGGAIVAERIFGINGLGLLVVKSLFSPQPEPLLVLASSMALVTIGLLFRTVQRLVVLKADPRKRR